MGRPIKRVLMLAHPEMDHLAYMMFDGLYKVLGKDNLSVYPFIRHYQGGIDEGYILDDGKKGYTSPPGYVTHHETPERSFDDLANDIRSFDILYISSARTHAINSLNQFIARCGRNNLPPIIFGEGEDYQSLNTIRSIKQKYNQTVSFKRELLQSELEKNSDLQPLYPLPFSTITDNMPPDNPDKDIDIAAFFGNTHPLRENIIRLINTSHLYGKYKIYTALDHCNNGPISNNITLRVYKEYLEIMSRAKINIVARGHGYDTLRRFEASCYSGLVMSDNIPIITPDPFIDNQHIIYYNSNLSDLINRIEYYLNSPGERLRIGRSGKEHSNKYHTTESRARYFLNKIEQHI